MKIKSVTDHPRACGENIFGKESTLSKFGSPPRMRGKRHLHANLHHTERITPAHAGKTITNVIVAKQHSDHPRACGENKK